MKKIKINEGMSLLSKLMYRLNTISAKIPARFFTEKVILIIISKSKRNIIAKTILKKENKVGESSEPNFKTYCLHGISGA